MKEMIKQTKESKRNAQLNEIIYKAAAKPIISKPILSNLPEPMHNFTSNQQNMQYLLQPVENS